MSKKIAAVYCRTAVADDTAIHMQKMMLTDSVREHLGDTDIVYYIDNGYSGVNCDRPGFGQLNQDIADGKVGWVFTRSLSRICRNTCKLLEWISGLSQKDVIFIVMDQQIGTEELAELGPAILREEII